MSEISFVQSGKASTVWLDPSTWPVPGFNLPGLATTVWLNPECWPVLPLRLPAAGFTLWLDPATWPMASAPVNSRSETASPATASSEAEPAGENLSRIPPAAAEDTLALPSHLSDKLSEMRRRFGSGSTPSTAPPRAATVGALFGAAKPSPVKPEESQTQTETPPERVVPWETPAISEPTAAPSDPAPGHPGQSEHSASTIPAPGIAAPASAPLPFVVLQNRSFTFWTEQAVSAASLPVSCTALKLPGKAFTLWSKPALVAPIPMRNGMTAAELEFSTRQSTAVPAPPAHSAPATAAPGGNRWLPLAAAIALIGLAGLKMASDNSKLEAREKEAAALQAKLAEADRSALTLALEQSVRTQSVASKIAGYETEINTLTEANKKAATELTTIRESAEKSKAAASEKAVSLTKISAELEAVKKELPKLQSVAQSQIATATEDAAKVKREAAAEVVTLRESLSKLEAEKAVSLKNSAQAAQEIAALQAELEALKKPAP